MHHSLVGLQRLLHLSIHNDAIAGGYLMARYCQPYDTPEDSQCSLETSSNPGQVPTTFYEHVLYIVARYEYTLTPLVASHA